MSKFKLELGCSHHFAHLFSRVFDGTALRNDCMFPYILVCERLFGLLGTVVKHRVAKNGHFSIYVADYGSKILVRLIIELKNMLPLRWKIKVGVDPS